MDKPIKPTETLAESFGGLKENFSEDKIENGYQPDIPDILGGANLNYLLDTMGKKFKYNDAISDFINELAINKVITVDANNKLIQASALLEKEEISSSTDLNSLKIGLYVVNGIANSSFPQANSNFYGTLIQFGGSFKPQLLLGGFSGECSYYFRRWQTENNSFTIWQKVQNEEKVLEALALKADKSTTYTKIEVNNALNLKQDNLIAGENIEIVDNVISAVAASSYSLFDIVMKDHILTYEEKQGLEPLGSYVYKTALAGSRYGYPDFYAKCVDEYNNSTDATFKKYKSSNVINNFGCIDKEGVLSKFNAQQTCQMSGFLVGNGLELVINFTTDSADIATAQTIFGAKTVYDGMYIQIYNSKLRVYVSSNGTSWNVANAKVGTYTFLLGHEYCVRYRNSVTGNHVFSIYDGVNWIDDITIESSTFVWGEYHNFGIDAAGSYPFLGTIDLNKSYMIDLGGNGKYNWNGCNYYEFAYKEHSNGHKFYDVSDTTAVEAINEYYSKYGLAWLYGIDTANERVCLPRNDYLTSYVDNVQQAHGNGIVLAVTDGTNYSGLTHINTGDYNYLTGRPDIYGMPVSTKNTASYNLTNRLGVGLTDDPEKSGIVVDIKNTPNGLYAYMVVGNTTTEGAVTEAVEVTTSENDTVPLFTGQYFDFSPNNVSWLKAGGQANSGGIYTTCYQELVNVLNGETKYGDLKVIDTANMVAGVDYSLYWKVDQAAMTFTCPSAISSKSYKDVASVVGNGISIGITNGTTDTGLRMGAYSTFYALTPSAELYGAPLGSTGATTPYTLNSNIGLTTDGTKSGIEAHLVENTEAQLYFKVANAVENLELLDAGKVLETLASKLDTPVRYVVEKSDKSLLPSWYTVYSDGWCEQGGQSSVATATTTITLLKSYVGTNYSLSMTGSAGYPFITSRSTGSFVADTSAAATVDWVAKGYIN